MQFFYSKSTGGFYIDEIHGDNMPADVVPIAQELHTELLTGQAQGKLIEADENGYPILNDPPPPTAEQLARGAYLNRDALLREAALRIAPLQDAVDLDMATDEEKAELLAWKQYRVALNRIQLQEGFPQNFTWPVSPEGE